MQCCLLPSAGRSHPQPSTCSRTWISCHYSHCSMPGTPRICYRRTSATWGRSYLLICTPATVPDHVYLDRAQPCGISESPSMHMVCRTCLARTILPHPTPCTPFYLPTPQLQVGPSAQQQAPRGRPACHPRRPQRVCQPAPRHRSQAGKEGTARTASMAATHDNCFNGYY